MGFSVLIDIVASMIIGGVLITILWRVNEATIANTYENSGELSLQQNLATIAMIIENDFRKIGYCSDWLKIPDPTKSIILADSTKIKFLTDVESNGIVDTMYYYLGPTSELTVTQNPRDRVLYRVINNQTPVASNLGVTQFNIIYFNSASDTIAFPVLVPGEVSTMEINVTVENTFRSLANESTVGYKGDYSGASEEYLYAFWRQIRLVARNLRNR